MGYIYKIQNKINKKIYIGQTTRDIQIRFKEHISESNRDNPKAAIHKAIKKYGKENFFIEIIEEIDNKLLDDREIYWIAQYNSTNKERGYNLTSGGNGYNTRNLLDSNWIANLYREGMCATEIIKITGYSPHAVYSEITKQKLNQISHNSKKGYPVAALDIKTKNIIKKFSSLTYATQWVIDNNFTKSTERKNVLSNIRRSINNETRNAYGFKWIKI